jgi:hypothetical protein
MLSALVAPRRKRDPYGQWSAPGKALSGAVRSPLVAGQWQKGASGFELVVTTNTTALEIPVTGELKLLQA